MRTHPESKKFWKIMGGVIPVLVLGLSLSLASQAQATAIFDVPQYVLAEVSFELPDMVSIVLFSDDSESTDGTMGNATADAGGEGLATSEFIRARTFVSGEADPVGWAVAEAQAIASVSFTNVSQEVKAIPIIVDLSGTASGSITDLLNESSEANFEAAVDLNDGGSSVSGGGGVPPGFVFSASDDVLFSGIINLIPGQTFNIAVTSFARGEAHSPVPEPTSLLLMGSGLIGLAIWRWRRNTCHRNAA